MSEVCIAGAGVSGLALALHLERSGASVTVFEASERIGGALRTTEKQGFTLEYGANSFACDEPFYDFLVEHDLWSDVQPPTEHATKRFLAYRDTRGKLSLAAVEPNPIALAITPLLSLSGKLRLLAEPFARSSSAPDTSVDEFCRRHFGAEFTDRIVAAALTGVWAADIRTLSCRSALRRLWELETQHRSLLFGMVSRAVSRRGKKRNVPRGSYSFRGGMRTLTDRLVEKLQSTTLHTSTAITRATDLGDTPLILTTNADHCAEMVRSIDSALADTIASVPYAPVGILHLALEREAVTHPLDGFGFLMPPMYGRKLMGALFSSSIFAGRAPEGFHLLTCFVGGTLQPDAADVRRGDVREEVFADLTEILGLTKVPQVLDWTHLPRAIPSYPVGHFQLEEQVEQFHQSQSNIRLAGSWFRGLSVPQRVEEVLR